MVKVSGVLNMYDCFLVKTLVISDCRKDKMATIFHLLYLVLKVLGLINICKPCQDPCYLVTTCFRFLNVQLKVSGSIKIYERYMSKPLLFRLTVI